MAVQRSSKRGSGMQAEKQGSSKAMLGCMRHRRHTHTWALAVLATGHRCYAGRRESHTADPLLTPITPPGQFWLGCSWLAYARLGATLKRKEHGSWRHQRYLQPDTRTQESVQNPCKCGDSCCACQASRCETPPPPPPQRTSYVSAVMADGHRWNKQTQRRRRSDCCPAVRSLLWRKGLSQLHDCSTTKAGSFCCCCCCSWYC